MSDDSERVARLQSKVDELEATVRGLTEELVDATERIRQLEDATAVDPAGDHGAAEDAAATAETSPTVDTTKGSESEESADAGSDGEEVVEDDDIIVA